MRRNTIPCIILYIIRCIIARYITIRCTILYITIIIKNKEPEVFASGSLLSV
jgi:hypothetical protein